MLSFHPQEGESSRMKKDFSSFVEFTNHNKFPPAPMLFVLRARDEKMTCNEMKKERDCGFYVATCDIKRVAHASANRFPSNVAF